MEKQRALELIMKKYITPEELQELQDNKYVPGVEYVGISKLFVNFYEYEVHLINEGFSPDDMMFTCTVYTVYCDYEPDDDEDCGHDDKYKKNCRRFESGACCKCCQDAECDERIETKEKENE